MSLKKVFCTTTTPLIKKAKDDKKLDCLENINRNLEFDEECEEKVANEGINRLEVIREDEELIAHVAKIEKSVHLEKSLTADKENNNPSVDDQKKFEGFKTGNGTQVFVDNEALANTEKEFVGDNDFGEKKSTEVKNGLGLSACEEIGKIDSVDKLENSNENKVIEYDYSIF